MKKIWVREAYKQDKAEQKLVSGSLSLSLSSTVVLCVCLLFLKKEDADKRQKNLEEAKQLVLTEDKTLPTAKKV